MVHRGGRHMKTVDVVIPTMGKPHAIKSLSLLRYIPWPIRLILVPEGKNWWEAVNIGFAEVGSNDVILMDDDVFLRADTFKFVDKHYDQADIFGFKLLYPDGKTVQHAGGKVKDSGIFHMGNGQPNDDYNHPLYCCHVTTSLTYIKNHVLRVLGGMATDYPGLQYEDVDWSFRAIKAGFKLLYTPGEAIHLETASKRMIPGYVQKFNDNYMELRKRWFSDTEFIKTLEEYPKMLDGVTA